ncbi:MAG: response regulator [Coriobacteriales bacterium]|jgi:signal transduction histidine kinase/CheY-like chemotaxis protein|nr:response regulator [Coriobacteriales bacterium]
MDKTSEDRGVVTTVGATGALPGLDDTANDLVDVNALLVELETLREQNRQMTLEVRKAQRALNDEQLHLQRIRTSNEARRQFQEVIQAERSRLERNMNLLLVNSRDLILLFDEHDKLVFATYSLLRALSLASFGLIDGKGFREVFSGWLPEDDIVEVETYLATGERAEPVLKMQVRANLYDGIDEDRDYHMDVSLMTDGDHEKQGWLVIIYDTTDLMKAKREAEQANAAKSDFLATISHEIRTPMNAIIGLAKMMHVTTLDERQTELLGKIEVSSNALLSLINDILDFSKIEAGKLELLCEYFDLGVFLHDLDSLFELMLLQKSLKLNSVFADDLPQVIYADAKRIRQIVTNIMNNAFKYTPSGWVDFSVRRCLTENGLACLRFDITDTGIGIKEEEIDRLFQAFEQLDVMRNKHIVGTGLGLAITRRLVEMMGGHVSVQSVYGEGSTFSIELPLIEGTIADLPAEQQSARVFTAPEARVLVVDDVEVNLEIAEFMLEPFGVQVKRAMDGLQALRSVEQEHFDLVLMDHMMPIMDGVEATRQIRLLGGSAGRVPIVALTANAISGVQQMFAEAGFDGFISKPIDPVVLANVLYEKLPRELIRE